MAHSPHTHVYSQCSVRRCMLVNSIVYKLLYTNAHWHCSTRIHRSAAQGDINDIYTAYLPSLRTMLVCWLARPLSSLGVCKKWTDGQVHPQALPPPPPPPPPLSLPHSPPPRDQLYKFTILSVVQSVLNLTGSAGGEVEWVGVGSSALVSPSSSSPLLAVLGGVSSSPCGGWMGASSLSGNPVPPASPPDAIPGCSC